MQARGTRVTRGVLAAAVATFAAAFSHGVAAGQAPSIVALAGASVLAVVVCVALAGRATPLRLAAAVVLSQAGFHTLFALAPAATGTAGSTHGSHGSHLVITVTTDAVAHVHAPADAAMWLGHAAAAVVTILALARGERAVVALLHSLRLTVRALLGVIAALPALTPARAMPAWPPRFPATTALLPSDLRRRGPPAVRPFSCFA
jgi:hypothetical protein